jgi:hypothetical protein
MYATGHCEEDPPEPRGHRSYRVTADAIVGRGRVYRHGQTVTDYELAGYGELFEDWGAVEALPPVPARLL